MVDKYTKELYSSRASSSEDDARISSLLSRLNSFSEEEAPVRESVVKKQQEEVNNDAKNKTVEAENALRSEKGLPLVKGIYKSRRTGNEAFVSETPREWYERSNAVYNTAIEDKAGVAGYLATATGEGGLKPFAAISGTITNPVVKDRNWYESMDDAAQSVSDGADQLSPLRKIVRDRAAAWQAYKGVDLQKSQELYKLKAEREGIQRGKTGYVPPELDYKIKKLEDAGVKEQSWFDYAKESKLPITADILNEIGEEAGGYLTLKAGKLLPGVAKATKGFAKVAPKLAKVGEYVSQSAAETALQGGQVYVDKYNQAIAEYRKNPLISAEEADKLARTDANFTALLNMGAETFGENILRSKFNNIAVEDIIFNTAKDSSISALKVAAGESLGEGITSVAQVMGQNAYDGNGLTVGLRDNLQQSMTVGALVGGPIAGGYSGAETLGDIKGIGTLTKATEAGGNVAPPVATQEVVDPVKSVAGSVPLPGNNAPVQPTAKEVVDEQPNQEEVTFDKKVDALYAPNLEVLKRTGKTEELAVVQEHIANLKDKHAANPNDPDVVEVLKVADAKARQTAQETTAPVKSSVDREVSAIRKGVESTEDGNRLVIERLSAITNPLVLEAFAKQQNLQADSYSGKPAETMRQEATYAANKAADLRKSNTEKAAASADVETKLTPEEDALRRKEYNKETSTSDKTLPGATLDSDTKAAPFIERSETESPEVKTALDDAEVKYAAINNNPDTTPEQKAIALRRLSNDMTSKAPREKGNVVPKAIWNAAKAVRSNAPISTKEAPTQEAKEEQKAKRDLSKGATAKKFKDMSFFEKLAISKQLRRATDSAERAGLLKAISSGKVTLAYDETVNKEGQLNTKDGRIFINLAEFTGANLKERKARRKQLGKGMTDFTHKDEVKRQKAMYDFYSQNTHLLTTTSSNFMDAVRHEFRHDLDLRNSTDLHAVDKLLADDSLYIAMKDFAASLGIEVGSDRFYLEALGYYTTALSNMSTNPELQPVFILATQKGYDTYQDTIKHIESFNPGTYLAKIAGSHTTTGFLDSITKSFDEVRAIENHPAMSKLDRTAVMDVLDLSYVRGNSDISKDLIPTYAKIADEFGRVSGNVYTELPVYHSSKTNVPGLLDSANRLAAQEAGSVAASSRRAEKVGSVNDNTVPVPKSSWKSLKQVLGDSVDVKFLEALRFKATTEFNNAEPILEEAREYLRGKIRVVTDRAVNAEMELTTLQERLVTAKEKKSFSSKNEAEQNRRFKITAPARIKSADKRMDRYTEAMKEFTDKLLKLNSSKGITQGMNIALSVLPNNSTIKKKVFALHNAQKLAISIKEAMASTKESAIPKLLGNIKVSTIVDARYSWYSDFVSTDKGYGQKGKLVYLTYPSQEGKAHTTIDIHKLIYAKVKAAGKSPYTMDNISYGAAMYEAMLDIEANTGGIIELEPSAKTDVTEDTQVLRRTVIVKEKGEVKRNADGSPVFEDIAVRLESGPRGLLSSPTLMQYHMANRVKALHIALQISALQSPLLEAAPGLEMDMVLMHKGFNDYDYVSIPRITPEFARATAVLTPLLIRMNARLQVAKETGMAVEDSIRDVEKLEASLDTAINKELATLVRDDATPEEVDAAEKETEIAEADLDAENAEFEEEFGLTPSEKQDEQYNGFVADNENNEVPLGADSFAWSLDETEATFLGNNDETLNKYIDRRYRQRSNDPADTAAIMETRAKEPRPNTILDSASKDGFFRSIGRVITPADINAAVSLVSIAPVAKFADTWNAAMASTSNTRHYFGGNKHAALAKTVAELEARAAVEIAEVNGTVSRMNNILNTTNLTPAERDSFMSSLISIDENSGVSSTRTALINNFKRVWGARIPATTLDEIMYAVEDARTQIDSLIDKVVTKTLGNVSYDNASPKLKMSVDNLLSSKKQYLYTTYHKFSIASGQVWKSAVKAALHSAGKTGRATTGDTFRMNKVSARSAAIVNNALDALIASWDNNTSTAFLSSRLAGWDNLNTEQKTIQARFTLEAWFNNETKALDPQGVLSTKTANQGAGALDPKVLEGIENMPFRELLGEIHDYGRRVSESVENQIGIVSGLAGLEAMHGLGVLVRPETIPLAEAAMFKKLPLSRVYSIYSDMVVHKDFEYMIEGFVSQHSLNSIDSVVLAMRSKDAKATLIGATSGVISGVAKAAGYAKMFSVFTAPKLWAALALGNISFAAKASINPITQIHAAKIASLWFKEQGGSSIDPSHPLYNDYRFIIGTEVIDSAVFAEMARDFKKEDYDEVVRLLGDTSSSLSKLDHAGTIGKDKAISAWTYLEAIPKIAAALQFQKDLNAYAAKNGDPAPTAAAIGEMVRNEFPSAKGMPMWAKVTDAGALTMFMGFTYQTLYAGTYGLTKNLAHGLKLHKNANNAEAQLAATKFSTGILIRSAAQHLAIYLVMQALLGAFEFPEWVLNDEQLAKKKQSEKLFNSNEDPNYMIFLGMSKDDTPLWMNAMMMANPLDIFHSLLRRAYAMSKEDNTDTAWDVFVDSIPTGFVGDIIKGKTGRELGNRAASMGILRTKKLWDSVGYQPVPDVLKSYIYPLLGVTEINPYDRISKTEFRASLSLKSKKASDTTLETTLRDAIYGDVSLNASQMRDKLQPALDMVKASHLALYNDVRDSYKASGLTKVEYLKALYTGSNDNKDLIKTAEAIIDNESLSPEVRAKRKLQYAEAQAGLWYKDNVMKGKLDTGILSQLYKKGPANRNAVGQYATTVRNTTSAEAVLFKPKKQISVKVKALGAHDADTIIVQTADGGIEHIRIQNIDAFELDQKIQNGTIPIGKKGADYLNQLIANQTVTLIQYGRDARGRIIARVQTKEGLDIGTMVAEKGYAIVTDIDDMRNGSYPTTVDNYDEISPKRFRDLNPIKEK